MGFAENIRRFRELKGWSQEELAAAAALHRTYVSGIERGKRNPTLKIILKLAEALAVPPGALFGEEAEP
jgi:transcriptional regulator with XRE-family HTH domain